ncbi:MAG: hypothetical protein V7765_09460 [Oleispira sp.]
MGFLLDKQLNTNSSNSNIETSSDNSVVPTPPRNQQEILELKEDLNQLMLDTADKRSERIEQSLND